jgi:oligosaccharide translocation protein RFT1
VLFALGLGEWFLHVGGHPQVPFFREALRICEVAAVVELLSEPAFVVVQQRMLYKVRAKAEASAVVVKTLATAATVLGAHRRGKDWGVLPFAMGELAYCATLTVVYLWQTNAAVAAQREKEKEDEEEKEVFSLILRPIKTRCVVLAPPFPPSPDHPSPIVMSYHTYSFVPLLHSSPNEFYLFSTLSKPLVHLSLSLYVQSGIKYLLTQGDTFVSARFATLEDQGKYALASNYGGLIARMLLRPIEDSSRNLFASLCHSSSSENNNNNNKPPRSSPQTHQASTTLTTLLRLYTLLSLPLLALGPPIAPHLLTLIAGTKWSATGAGAVLSTYIYSIPLLAINGVSEAFVSAAASPAELQRQSAWMAGFSGVFALATVVFLGPLDWGARGLVAANCVNMGLRVGFNLRFAGRWFRERGMGFSAEGILPGAAAVAVAAVAAGAVRGLEGKVVMMGGRWGVVGEIGRIGALGVLLVGVL